MMKCPHPILPAPRQMLSLSRLLPWLLCLFGALSALPRTGWATPTKRKVPGKAVRMITAGPSVDRLYDRDRVRGKDPSRELDQILKGSAFRKRSDSQAARSWVERFALWLQTKWKAFWEWLTSRLKRQKPQPREPREPPGWLAKLLGPIGKFLKAIYVILNHPVFWGFLLLLLLLWLSPRILAWWEQRRSQEEHQETQASEAADEEEEEDLLMQEPQTLWSLAEQLAREGRFRLALRQLYRALLLGLHREGILSYEPTATNWEYLRALSSRPQLSEPFRSVILQFERVWYGFRPCGAGDFATCKSLAQSILDAPHPPTPASSLSSSTKDTRDTTDRPANAVDTSRDADAKPPARRAPDRAAAEASREPQHTEVEASETQNTDADALQEAQSTTKASETQESDAEDPQVVQSATEDPQEAQSATEDPQEAQESDAQALQEAQSATEASQETEVEASQEVRETEVEASQEEASTRESESKKDDGSS